MEATATTSHTNPSTPTISNICTRVRFQMISMTNENNRLKLIIPLIPPCD